MGQEKGAISYIDHEKRDGQSYSFNSKNEPIERGGGGGLCGPHIRTK